MTHKARALGSAPPLTAALISLLIAVLLMPPTAFAREPSRLANVVILATGGTIAGSGATSTTTVGYTAATAGVDNVEPMAISVDLGDAAIYLCLPGAATAGRVRDNQPLLRRPSSPNAPGSGPRRPTADRAGEPAPTRRVKGRPAGPSEDTSEASPAATLDAPGTASTMKL